MHCLKVTAADIKCIGSCFCVVRGADTDKIRAGDFFIIYDAEMHFLHYNIFKYVWYKISWMEEEWMNYSAETKPGMADPYWYAAYTYEKNSRLLLQKKDDFWEKPHFNITMHHNGIESFKQSNILCGFSKEALLAFGWYISIDSGGVKLFNECGVQIGQLECYYGNRTSLGNKYHSNQPHMQRWIVRKAIFDKAIQRIPAIKEQHSIFLY